MITTTEQVITDESFKKRQIINPNIIKIRIMGTVEDIEWLKMVLKKKPFFNVIDQSDIYCCNGTKNLRLY